MSKPSAHSPQDWKQPPNNENLVEVIENELEFEPFDFTETNIESVPVFTKHLPYAPCIHIRIGFRYGAMHDEVGREGVAHFLEHMLFDGSSMFENEKETQEFGKVVMLDTFNAHTSPFELFVTGKCLPHNFDLALEGIFSMIIAPKLTKESYEHEMKVITQEAWGVFLNQKRIEYIKKERANNMSDLPDRLRLASSLGWPETIAKITHDDIKEAHKKYFVKENMEIYLAGNIASIGDTTTLENKLKTFIEQVPSGEKAKLPYIPATLSAPKVARFDHTYTDVGLSERQQASISLSSYLPRLNKKAGMPNTEEENERAAASELAGDLLADLVYRKLRLENSWCYGAGASSEPHVDYVHFSMGGTINFNHIEEAIEILWGIIKDIENGHFQEDFDKTKKLSVENTLARERTTERIIESTADVMRIDNAIITLKKTLLDITKVTFQDVQRVIAESFAKERVFIEIVRPTAGDDFTASKITPEA